MKITVIATLCAALVLGLASVAGAQLKAGSPEEAAYQKIQDEKNTDARLALLLNFETTYPDSKVMSAICMMVMDVYSEKNNKAKIAEYGNKAIVKDPENVSALLKVSNNYLLEGTDISKAVEYSQKAKTLIDGLRGLPTPNGMTDDQWKQYLDASAKAADQNIDYAKTITKK